MTVNRRVILKSALGTVILLAGAGWGAIPAIAQSSTANKTLTWLSHVSYRNMNPASNYDQEIFVLGNVYETLFEYRDGNVQPKLAVSWERSSDAKTWTVKLRDGVKFHDGSALNSAAVKKSFEYVRDLGKGAGFLYAGLTNVDTPDALTAVFHFKEPIAFDLVAAGQYGAFVIAPSAIDKGDEWLSQGNAIGTGPYKLSQFQQGKLVVLDKFDDYWGGWKEGQYERVIHPYVAEPATRVQMIRSGEAGIAPVPSSQIEGLDGVSNVSVAIGPSWRTQFFYLNTQKYPTDNLKFRQALQHLWDYDAVIDGVFHGAAKKPEAPVASTLWGHGTYDLPSFDPAKALTLLEESGVPKKDWKVKALYTPTSQEASDAIQLFQANASAIGLEVELELEQVASTYMSKARAPETSGNLNAMIWWPAYATPSDFLVSAFHTEKKPAWNLSFYYNKDYDQRVDQAVKLEAADIKAATKAYIAAQDKLMEDAVAIFYAEPARINAYATAIKGMEEANNPAYEWLSIYNLRH
ncbi:D,D-dipeptide-binding periplasmic protein DdpA (plasmid) [Sinorhizobium americanum CCGM7]|uniref:ABC transporter substrate-binding protein n=1 Tax=Sinorhizobium americanum TaxID=194963 RepID=UPI000564AFEA|nr:ABC transporter substrate-binding protein [Sinorhizobium americanum]APG86928.1 D,D-dipeptide-binding periplasmic protein DdpA [Sinorhizobium americanum CCGM7]